MRQARGLESRLSARGFDLPVYVGMRNWHPFLADTLRTMAADGVRRAIGLVLAAHRSYSSCTQYRQNVVDARAEVVAAGLPDVPVIYTGDWHTHPKFVEANARHVPPRIERLPDDLRSRAQVVFTAHSVPSSMSGASALPRSRLWNRLDSLPIAVATRDWAVVFQSRSGRPEDPWLGPDVLRLPARGTRAWRACRGARADRIRVRSHRGAVRPRRMKRRRSAARSACRWFARKPSTTTRSSWI